MGPAGHTRRRRWSARPGVLALAMLVAHVGALDRCIELRTTYLPPDDVAACGLSDSDLFEQDSIVYREKRCQSPACMRLYAIADAKNPNECIVNPGFFSAKFRADVLAPLYAVCAALKSSTSSPPPSDPSPSTTQPSPDIAKPLEPSTTRPTARPLTQTPSTTVPTTEEPSVTPAMGSTVSDTSNSPASTPVPTPQDATASSQLKEPSSSMASETTTTPSVTNASSRPERAGRQPSSDQPSAITVSSSNTGSTRTVLGVGLSVGAVVLFGLVLGWKFCHRRRRSKQDESTGTEADTPKQDLSTAFIPRTDSYGAGNFTILADWIKQIDDKLRGDVVLELCRLNAKTITTHRFLGRGSHAFVYLVSYADGTMLASKRLGDDQITPTKIDLLLDEVHIVSKLEHSSIVRFAGVAWASPLDFQVLFEFMAGGDLRDYLDRTKSDEPAQAMTASSWTGQKLRMALAIAEGLVYTHSFNPPLVHRDLKSRNILLTQDLQAKISDFGVSRYVSDNDTMTTGIGTNRWLAPEVIKGGGTYTERCDLYSFGVVLTELDTHDIPLVKEVEAAKSEGKLTSELWLLREIAIGTLRPSISTSCPPEIRDLVEQCLSLEPDQRPSTLEVAYRLRSIVSGRAKPLR